MRRLLEFMLGGLPVSSAALQAIAATLADWRHETQRAQHVVARLLVALRSTLALGRVLGGSAICELRAEVRSPFLWRVAAGSLAMVVALGFLKPMYPTVTDGIGSLTLMSLAQGLFLSGMFLPLVVFVAGRAHDVHRHSAVRWPWPSRSSFGW